MTEEIQCPVCGYYCLGNGGHGCIDKPSLVNAKSDAQRFHELTGGKLHYEIESIQKDYYYCSCGFVEKDRSAFNGHIAKHNPTYSNAADILNRMKEFCGEEKYLIFISWLCSTLSFSIDNFRIVMDFINTYILNPSALLRKAVEFMEATNAKSI